MTSHNQYIVDDDNVCKFLSEPASWKIHELNFNYCYGNMPPIKQEPSNFQTTIKPNRQISQELQMMSSDALKYWVTSYILMVVMMTIVLMNMWMMGVQMMMIERWLERVLALQQLDRFVAEKLAGGRRNFNLSDIGQRTLTYVN